MVEDDFELGVEEEEEEEGTNLVRSECVPDDHFTILRGGDNMSFVEGRPVKTKNFTNMTL